MTKPVLLVTGASSGIGLAVVNALLDDHHARVVALSRSTSPDLALLIDAHPTSLLAISCDVADEHAQTRAFVQAIDTFGPVLDGLILNAGTLDPLTRIGDPSIPLDAWKLHFDVNFFSLITTLKLALPALRSSSNTGRVIFVSSGAATGNTPAWAPYNAAKAAMNSLARTLAKEEPCLVSLAIAPGKVDTAMQQSLRTTGAPHMDSSDLKIFLDAQRDGTLVKPSDVGYVIANLALHAPLTLSGSFVRLRPFSFFHRNRIRSLQQAPKEPPKKLPTATISISLHPRVFISPHALQNRVPAMTHLHPGAPPSTFPFHTSKIIDVHHHVFLDAQKKAKKNAQVGWVTPPEHLPWRPSPAISAMDTMGVQTAILSPPPVAIMSRTHIRAMNISLSQLRAAHPAKFGFFAGLPALGDVQGTLDEIAFAMDHLNANGFALISSYGMGKSAKYIADDSFDPIWEELNRRHAIVFLHGAQTPSSTPYPHPLLGLPISEVPNETYKAAAHLVVTGKKRRFHNVKIILAHLGGSTLFLAPRVAALSHYMGCSLAPDEILQDFKTFYYETALSSHPTTLAALDAFVPIDRILFGSDYPAVSTATSSWYTKHLEDHYAGDRHKLDRILRDNALTLFPRLQA